MNVHYDAAKAGVDSLTRSLASEFAADGIRVNSILPGGMASEGGKNISASYKIRGPMIGPGRIPMARMASFIVRSREKYTWEELKEMLIAEVKRRDLRFGIIVKDVSSGETRTDHYDFQAFKGVPTEVYTVSLEGGVPVRHTWEGRTAAVIGWTAAHEILYTTSAHSTLPNAQLVRLDTLGERLAKLAPRSRCANFSPRATIAFPSMCKSRARGSALPTSSEAMAARRRTTSSGSPPP